MSDEFKNRAMVEIQAAQRDLLKSIQQTQALAEETDRLIARHRRDCGGSEEPQAPKPNAGRTEPR